MNDFTTIAKPYAKAVYALAKEQSKVDAWQDLLSTCEMLVQAEPVQQLLSMPTVDRSKLAPVFVKLLGDKVDQFGRNFLQLLAKNNRIHLLADIAKQFSAYKAKDENKTYVNVTTAVDVDEAFQQKLLSELNQRLNTDSELNFMVDESIIGGAILQMGDKVIDMSLQNALKQLQKKLNIGDAAVN